MAISLWPIVITGGSILLIVAGIVTGIRQRRSKAAFRYTLIGLAGVAVPPIAVHLIGTLLWVTSLSGISAGQFTYARWLESTPDILGKFSLIPFDYRFDESWYWLDQASTNGHVEATYAIGNRLKTDMFVPTADDGRFRSRGQILIDKSIAAGFRPDCPEEQYYFGRFRIRL